MRTVLLAVIVGLCLFGMVMCEMSLWSECRADHSWFYCMRTVGPR